MLSLPTGPTKHTANWADRKSNQDANLHLDRDTVARGRPRCLRLGAGGFFGGNPHRGDGFDTPSPLGSSSVRLRAETAASIYRADRTVSGGWARDGRRRAPSFTAMP